MQRWNAPFDYYLIMTGEPPEPGIDGGLMLTTEGRVETTLTRACGTST
ncbi:hypothetical protein LLF88_05695 [bacterium]|nr:hypothetical protein [bacterium]